MFNIFLSFACYHESTQPISIKRIFMENRVLTRTELNESKNGHIQSWIKNRFTITQEKEACFLIDYNAEKITVRGHKITESKKDPDPAQQRSLIRTLNIQLGNKLHEISIAYEKVPFDVIHTALRDLYFESFHFFSPDCIFNMRGGRSEPVYFEIIQDNFRFSDRNNPGETIGTLTGQVKTIFELTEENTFRLERIETTNPIIADAMLGKKIPSYVMTEEHFIKKYPTAFKPGLSHSLNEILKDIKTRVDKMSLKDYKMHGYYAELYDALVLVNEQSKTLYTSSTISRQHKAKNTQNLLYGMCEDTLALLKTEPKNLNKKVAQAFHNNMQTKLEQPVFDAHRAKILKVIKGLLLCLILGYGFYRAYKQGGFFQTTTREKANQVHYAYKRLSRKLGAK